MASARTLWSALTDGLGAVAYAAALVMTGNMIFSGFSTDKGPRVLSEPEASVSAARDALGVALQTNV